MHLVSIDKSKDFIERVGWTGIQAFVGVIVAGMIKNGTDIEWRQVVYAALISAGVAAGKVILAQNVGDHPDGSAIPGGVIQVEKKTGK